MAERSNAPSKKTQDAAQDVTTLQKRGRRRLVGAIALVLLAVIILPMVFDPEPRPNAPLVSVRIPSEEGGKFSPKLTAKSPEADAAPAKAEPVAPPVAASVPEPAKPAAETPKAEEKPTAKVADVPAPKPAPKPVEKPVARAAEKAAPPAGGGEQFMVQVGAFASPEKVKEVTDQLKEAKLPHYTESIATAKGPVTRVRLGPFASKEAAEKARERAKGLGMNPTNPVAK